MECAGRVKPPPDFEELVWKKVTYDVNNFVLILYYNDKSL